MTIKKLVSITAIFLVVLVALFPTLLSLPIVNQYLLPQTVSVTGIKAGWFEGLQIDGLVIKDSQGVRLASIECITAEKPLISWLYKPADFGRIVVVKPTFELDPLAPLIFDDVEDESLFFIPDFCTFDIRDANIHFSKIEAELFDLNCLVDIKQKRFLHCMLSSKIKNEKAPGTISFSLDVSNLDELVTDYLHALMAPKSTILLNAKLVSVPTAIIDPSLLQTVGETLDCELEHTVGNQGSSFAFDIASKFLNGRISSKKKGHLVWERPATILKLTVDPEEAVELAVQRGGKEAHCRIGASFQQMPAVELDLHAAGGWPEIVAPDLVDFIGKNSVINAHVNVASIFDPGKESSGTLAMQSETGSFTSTISCVKNLFSMKSKSDTVTCELNAPFELDQAKVKCEADLVVRGQNDSLDVSAGLLYDRVACTFSSSGTFHGGYTPLTALLGSSLSGSWNCSSDHVTAHIQAQDLLADLNLAIVNEIGALRWKKPLTVVGTVTPARFKALFSLLNGKAPKLVLLQPAPFSLNCSDFNLAAFDFRTLDCTVDLLLGALVCQNQKSHTVTHFPELEGSATMQGKMGALSFSFASPKVPDAPYLFIKGEAHRLWDEKGIDLSKANINLDLTLKEFPLGHLPIKKFVKITGPKVDAALHIEIEKLSTGKARGTISSEQLEMALDLLIQEGKLLLAKPLTATFSLPHKTKGRVKLVVDTKEFCVPLAPFSLDTMVIPSITLDPGVVTVENGGLLGTILSLLRFNVSSHGQVPIWFTPIYLDVKEGIVTCKRTDMLVSNAFPMALWGKIDLVKDSVDCKLGLTGQALRRAFGIIIFSSDYLLQIPIQGTIDSPKLDTPMATAKIAALRLQQTPMPTTMIVGGILGIAASVVDKNDTPPAPTTTPLPWAVRVPVSP